MKHRFICVSSVLINWCWMWLVAFFNDVSSESEWLFTSEICFYHDYYYSVMILGISDEFVFYQFQPFFLLSRQSPPTDWPTLFEVNLVPRAFSLRKWLEETRLEVALAQGKRGRGGGGTPWCFWWWGWAAQFSISWTYFKPNMLFFTPIFRPVAKILTTDNKKKISSEWYIAVILIHLILLSYQSIWSGKEKIVNCFFTHEALKSSYELV